MYAIIKTGGKQYRVSQGDTLKVEKLHGDVGDELELGEVLLIGGGGETRIGTPRVAGAKVTARIRQQARAKKIIVFKKKRRSGYHKKIGHRQQQTVLEITGISA